MKYFPILIVAVCAMDDSGQVLGGKPPASKSPGREHVVFFEKKIRPVLVQHCYKCHSKAAGKSKGGLLVDTSDSLRKGGDSGPAVLPGKPAGSLLLQAIRYQELEMPPDGKLPARVIRDFEVWIKAGAIDPRRPAAKELKSKPVAAGGSPSAKIDYRAARQFWSFQRPQRHPRPAVETPSWLQRDIDSFVLRRMQEQRLSPNPRADRRALIRRAYFDVIGLPPEPEIVEAFVDDAREDAFAEVVERLLSSPQYGVRWARLWLDVARYAEDQAHIVGNNQSLFYPNAYAYRDWVIKSLNDDLPFDDFVQQQLAADLLAPQRQKEHVALGFIGLGPKYYRRNAPEVMADEWEDRVDTVTRGLLGLTVACARCHDHKYDPIPSKDYYALAGVFASTEMYNSPLPGKAARKNGQAKKPNESIHIIRDIKPRNLNVMIRGDIRRKGQLAPRGFLTVLSPQPRLFSQGSGRLELARAIASRSNPLTARVIVNRIWKMYFGKGLVGTPSNFGKLGQRPTHPHLLDDLAVRFMEGGWSLKWLHREILLSATYQQSSNLTADKFARDADNKWLSRAVRRRLSVESWRDAILSVAGRLNDSVGGPSMNPANIDETRRTLYSRISRLQVHRILSLFDFPDPNAHSAARTETTTPLQKLFVLNSAFMVHNAERLAERVLSAADEDLDRIHFAYRLLYSRPPTAEELRIGLGYLGGREAARRGRWNNYCQALLAANEMLIID